MYKFNGGIIVYYNLLNRNKVNVWDRVWEQDVYSKPELREEKAKAKVDKLLNHIVIESSTVVLDLGCGGGYVARELYNRTGAQIYGIDSSEEAICISQKNLKDSQLYIKKKTLQNYPLKIILQMLYYVLELLNILKIMKIV